MRRLAKLEIPFNVGNPKWEAGVPILTMEDENGFQVDLFSIGPKESFFQGAKKKAEEAADIIVYSISNIEDYHEFVIQKKYENAKTEYITTFFGYELTEKPDKQAIEDAKIKMKNYQDKWISIPSENQLKVHLLYKTNKTGILNFLLPRK